MRRPAMPRAAGGPATPTTPPAASARPSPPGCWRSSSSSPSSSACRARPARGDELPTRSPAEGPRRPVKAQREEVAKLRSLQSGLASEIRSTASALNGINANLDQTKTRIANLGKQIDKVRAVYGDLVAQVALLDRQVDAIGQEQEEKAGELRDRKALLAARIREAYRTDRTPLVQTVLSAGTFTDLVVDVGSYLDLGEQDRALAERIEADARTLDALRTLLVETRAARQELRAETLAQKKQLDARMKDLREAKARLAKLQDETEHQLAIQRAAYARMAKNKSALQSAIARDLAAQRKLADQIADIVARQRNLGNIPRSTTGRCSGRWRRRSPRSSAAPDSRERAGELLALPPGDRTWRRRCTRRSVPPATASSSSPARTPTTPTQGLDRHHRPQRIAPDLVRPHRQLGASARRLRRRPRLGRPGDRLRGHDRADDRPAPSLGRRLQQSFVNPRLFV